MKRHRISEFVPQHSAGKLGNKNLDSFGQPCPQPGCTGMLIQTGDLLACPLCKHIGSS